MPATPMKVDLRNVKEGGNFRPTQKPEGDYVAKIVKVDDHQPKDTSKKAGWVFTVKIQGDERSSYPIYTSPDEKQVWKLKKLFDMAGIKLPKSIVKIDPNKLVGKAVGVFLEHDEYDGKVKSAVADFMPVGDVVPPEDNDDQDADDLEPDDEIDTGNDDEDDDDDEDDEEVIPEPVKRKKKAAPEPEPEDDDDEEDEPEPEPVKKKRVKKAAPPPPVEDDEEDEDEDDEEDEEEPPPPPVKKRAKKKAAPKPADDDDDDLDLEDL